MVFIGQNTTDIRHSVPRSCIHFVLDFAWTQPFSGGRGDSQAKTESTFRLIISRVPWQLPDPFGSARNRRILLRRCHPLVELHAFCHPICPSATRAAFKGPQGESDVQSVGSHLEEELTIWREQQGALSLWRARATSVLLPTGEASPQFYLCVK